MTITDEDVEDFLAHYGVPGMKWGVRNAAGTNRSARREEERNARRERFSKGKATTKDKLIRDLDLDRSKSERKSDSKDVSSGEQTKVLVAAGVAFVAAKKSGMNTPVSVAVSASAAMAARKFIDSKKDEPVPVREKRLK